jgi:protein-tyrosine-phosphatase
VVLAFIGAGDVMMGFRVGLTTFLTSPAAIYAMLVGLCYAGLCVCTTLIFLDRRENTFCMPMHCGSSMLSGFTASAFLAYFFNRSSPGTAQTISAGFIVIALGFLSPLHHFDRVWNWVKTVLVNLRLRSAELIPGEPSVTRTELLPLARSASDRLIVFVCSGNTCRSPMAAAIANAEIAARFQIPFEALETVNVRALSAGVSARVGAPLTPEAQEVLKSLSVPARPHAARNLTAELADQAEVIFCMTSAHRKAVIEMIPAVAWKTYCLDAQGDVEDPIGMGLPVYVKCALAIQKLVRLRLNEMSLES